ncbi:MAG TPA: hypothetical protein VLB04_07740, partial [Methanotrichaceae archaeon]|nr:hypothetical protein [Methanotrichaceae archaeon]
MKFFVCPLCSCYENNSIIDSYRPFSYFGRDSKRLPEKRIIVFCVDMKMTYIHYAVTAFVTVYPARSSDL